MGKVPKITSAVIWRCINKSGMSCLFMSCPYQETLCPCLFTCAVNVSAWWTVRFFALSNTANLWPSFERNSWKVDQCYAEMCGVNCSGLSGGNFLLIKSLACGMCTCYGNVIIAQRGKERNPEKSEYFNIWLNHNINALHPWHFCSLCKLWDLKWILKLVLWALGMLGCTGISHKLHRTAVRTTKHT